MNALRPTAVVFPLLVVLAFFAPCLPAEDLGKAPPQALQRSFGTYCAGCHDEKQPEAGLEIDALNEGQWRDFDLLDEVVARLEEGDMPPKGTRPSLPDTTRKEMIAALEQRLDRLSAVRMAGTLNRLTRSEWCDTVEDILGLPVEKAYELPIDSSHPMGRLGEHQLLTPLAMRQYQTVIERHVNEAILDELPSVESFTIDFTKAENQIGNTGNEAMPWGILSHNDRTHLAMLNPVKTFAAEGIYEIVFDYYHTHGDSLTKLPKGEAPPPMSVDQNGHFGWFVDGGEVLNKRYTHDLDGKKLHPSGRKIYYRFDEPLRIHLSKDTKTVTFAVPGGGKGKRWVFKQAAIRGPIGKEYPANHANIFGNLPADSDVKSCREVVARLALRLFRRPVHAGVMTPYYRMIEEEYAAGGNLHTATKRSVKAMLCSPYFLFKKLGDAAELDDYMIATRLAYFLSNSAPDDRLLSLAAAGELSHAATRRQEAERLLADEQKTNRFARLFSKQWLGLSKFDDFSPNPAYIQQRLLHPLRPSIVAQPRAFVSELLRHDLSARNFIHSDFVVWDPPLFNYYNKRDETGMRRHDQDHPGFVRYDLSRRPDADRMKYGGLVTMPVIMCMTTDGETTQPILRGAWVVKHLLGKELAPPDSVPSLEIDLSNVDKPNEILRLHKQDASCHACHVKMDYMGLSLENYDVLGRWQSNYLFPVIEGNKFEIVTKNAVDSRAETPDGDTIAGVAGLKQHLLEREDEVMRNLLEKLFAYAVGRETQYRDRHDLGRLFRDAKANDYKFREMILSLVASPGFARR
jgi:mono/diheme cytochrome c family protein